MITPATRIVVLGAAGQLGRDLGDRLPGTVIRLTRLDAELTDEAAVHRALTRHRPDIVINCAAYNHVDKAEDDRERAFAVNGTAVQHLAEASRRMGFLLVHFSTDYVFGAQASRRDPYLEDDAPGPINVYGQSKLAGEAFVRSLASEHLVIRTCGLYGRWGTGGKGSNFVKTMLRKAREGGRLTVVVDQILTPSATADVATGTIQLLQQGARGLRHLTNAGQCSWFEFAKAIFALADVQADVSPVTSAEYGAKARRPAYSVLRSQFADTPRLRPWREALAAYLTGGA
jgi:dTDP-4-dehydrorhamnose reductase